MTWLTIAELLERYADERVATAVKASVETVAAIRAGEPIEDAETVRIQNRIETAIADAISEVQSAVAPRYALPLESDPPPLVKRLVADRALFHLHGDTVPAGLEDRHKSSQELLEQLRKGERVLVDADGTVIPQRPRVRMSSGEPEFAGPGGALEAY